MRDDDVGCRPVTAAAAVSTAVLRLAQATRETAVAGPVAWAMFGYLHPLGVELPRALLQVGQGLTVALTDGQLEQSDGQDPAPAVTAARDHLDPGG